MPDSPRFSIIIPTYNREHSIQNTLTGCFEQSFDDFEIVLVDDGSTDATLAALKKIDDPRLVVITQENAGPAAARNHGMRKARGEYLAFLDSDDVWYPDYLKNVDEALKQDANSVIYGRIIIDRGVNRYWVKPDRALGADEPIYDFLYVHGGFIQTSTMVIPQQLREQVSWDESVTFGDNDQFAIDCWNTGIRFHMISKPLTLYADIMSPDALSQLPIYEGASEKYTNFFKWMETQHDRMSDKALLGFQARFESVGLARTAPFKSIKLLFNAYRGGAIGLGGMFRQMIQNHTPRLYRRLTDQYVKFRGARLHTLER